VGMFEEMSPEQFQALEEEMARALAPQTESPATTTSSDPVEPPKDPPEQPDPSEQQKG
jgi:hypothetical protein